MLACARDRVRVRSYGAAWGRMGCMGCMGCRVGAMAALWRRYGGAMGRGRSQRGLGGPAGGLSAAAGPILRECADRASQGLSGALSSEQGRAAAIAHKKSPARSGARAGGQGGEVGGS